MLVFIMYVYCILYVLYMCIVYMYIFNVCVCRCVGVGGWVYNKLYYYLLLKLN